MDGNLAVLRSARNSYANTDDVEKFDDYLLGILSVHVSPEVWSNAVNDARKLHTSIHGGAHDVTPA